jgi:hypothetical protein
MLPLLFQQLEAFASQPGKAVFFRETGAEHKNVDENTPEGGFLEVRIQRCGIVHSMSALTGGVAQSEKGHPDATKVRGCQCKQRSETDAELAVRLNDVVHGVAAACVAE